MAGKYCCGGGGGEGGGRGGVGFQIIYGQTERPHPNSVTWESRDNAFIVIITVKDTCGE